MGFFFVVVTVVVVIVIVVVIIIAIFIRVVISVRYCYWYECFDVHPCFFFIIIIVVIKDVRMDPRCPKVYFCDNFFSHIGRTILLRINLRQSDNGRYGHGQCRP